MKPATSIVQKSMTEWRSNCSKINSMEGRDIALKDGYIVISYNGHSNRYTLPELIKILKEQRELIKTLKR